jgi:GGDEF domain-containing protein
VVERLFSKLEQITIPQLDGGKIVISVGAAICPEKGHDSFDSLYARADGALYISKKAIGNCLTFSET